MQFLYDSEVELWCAERGLTAGDRESLRDRLYFDPPSERRRSWYNPNAPQSAAALAAAALAEISGWDEAVLWVTRWGVWPSSEDWPAYYAARGRRDERRSIDEVPGHRFFQGEGDVLEEFTVLALQNGWDAFILAERGGQISSRRLRISHDEWIEVQDEQAGQINSQAV